MKISDTISGMQGPPGLNNENKGTDLLAKELMLNMVNLNKKINDLSNRLNSIENPTRCECIQMGYEPGLCRKRLVCSDIEKEYHTDKCWKCLTANYGTYLCTCDNEDEESSGNI